MKYYWFILFTFKGQIMETKQIELENRFNEYAVREQYQDQWYDLIIPIMNKLNIDPEDEEIYFDTVNTFITILYILAEREQVMYHNLIEMIMDKSDIDNSISYLSSILDIGNQYGLWKYDQLPVNDNALKVKANYLMSKECELALNQCMYKLPMIVKPRKVKHHENNRGSGYLTQAHDSLILNNKHHISEICREFIDTVNQVPLKLNNSVLQNYQHKIDLDSIKEKQAQGYTLSSWEGIILAEQNINLLNQQTKEIVGSILQDNPFYLTHKYDTRGRCYAQGYHISYQGDSYCKALIELAEPELILG